MKGGVFLLVFKKPNKLWEFAKSGHLFKHHVYMCCMLRFLLYDKKKNDLVVKAVPQDLENLGSIPIPAASFLWEHRKVI